MLLLYEASKCLLNVTLAIASLDCRIVQGVVIEFHTPLHHLR